MSGDGWILDHAAFVGAVEDAAAEWRASRPAPPLTGGDHACPTSGPCPICHED